MGARCGGEAALARDARIAAANRALFAARQITAFNLVSAPGSGKTSLLESAVRLLAEHLPLSVVEGDQETEHDADRIRAAGCPAAQVNTRAGCHLDAAMVHEAVDMLDPEPGSLLFIENVGNLICPAPVDLGERDKLVLLSVTEGEDKPLKYPPMFRAATVLVLTKIDLLPYLDFDLAACTAAARRVNPGLRVFATSTRTGAGVAELCDWLLSRARAVAPCPLAATG